MNKIGLHVCYWWGTGLETDIFKMLEQTAKAGADVIEMTPSWLLNMTADQKKKFRWLMEEYGITATLNGGLDATNDISSDDPKIRQDGIDHCNRVLEEMPSLNMTVWSGANYSAWLRRPDHPIDAAERQRICDLSINSMRQIIKTAEDVGVDYCFEVVNRFEQFLFNTSRESVEFAKAVGSDRAKVLLDIYHMNIEEDSIYDAIVHAAKENKLGHLHAGESNRRVPGVGKGHIDWDCIAKAISDSEYKGVITMEPFVLTNASNAHKTCTWRCTCADPSVEGLTADAKKGAQFLREKLKNAGVE